MKILHLIIFTLVAITVMSCLNESTCGECGNEFFPLNVGDKFLYRFSGDFLGTVSPPEEVVVSVKRAIDTLGKRYYEMENYYVIETGVNMSAYVRTDKNNVYFLAGNKEVLYYQFDIPEGSIYKVPYFTHIDPDDEYRNWITYMKVVEHSKNHILFETDVYKVDLGHYVRFERGKGRTQILNDNWVRNRYDLVKTYR